MTTYFTIGDFILIIPMALAGILFLGAVPCATQERMSIPPLPEMKRPGIQCLSGAQVPVLVGEFVRAAHREFFVRIRRLARSAIPKT